MHRVMIHPANYENCREAVEQAFTLFPLDIAGKKVVIKPNVLRSSAAEEHIVTNPAVLRAVIEKVEEMSPAEIIVGDNPGLVNYGDNENSFEKTGLMAAAKGYYKNLGDTSKHLIKISRSFCITGPWSNRKLIQNFAPLAKPA